METKTQLILTGLMLLGALVSYLLLKYTEKKHKNDPVYMEEQRQREEAYRKRIEEENRNLEQYDFSGDDYSDDTSVIEQNAQNDEERVNPSLDVNHPLPNLTVSRGNLQKQPEKFTKGNLSPAYAMFKGWGFLAD